MVGAVRDSSSSLGRALAGASVAPHPQPGMLALCLESGSVIFGMVAREAMVDPFRCPQCRRVGWALHIALSGAFR
jgi:hypothetical protein